MKNDVSRRAFLERMGSCAVGATALSQLSNRSASGQAKSYSEAPNAAPWTRPATLSNPNILFVIIDQMRWPVWMSPSQTTVFEQSIMPNLMGMLRNNSYVFQQYFTAATICTAARGTLLTGLYAPQTAAYTNSLSGTSQAALAPAFPTWATGIQTLNPAYKNNLWWFGKWHLSPCTNATPLLPFGFNTRTYPGGPAFNPSPNGVANEGTDGGQFKNQFWANDSEIAGDFIGWLTGQAPTPAPPTAPWCATVSMINPHDISEAPDWLKSSPFPPKHVPQKAVYFPPPPFPPASGAPALYSSPPTPWNAEDLLVVPHKPAVQYAFRKAQTKSQGLVRSWVTFLNQYYWLHNYVDQQIGRVLTALNSSPYAANTVVVFASDHGEYGGSHGLHDKGNGAYDEVIHVPLYVHFPGQNTSHAMNQMCSSVDFFGLMCDLATSGSGLWKSTYPDLAGRQSIWDFIQTNGSETRIAPNLGVPYIMQTGDDNEANGGVAKHHIVCFRTKANAANTSQPGAKLAVYSAWAKCQTIPNGTTPDFEFYDYNPLTSNNHVETGNDYYSANPTTQTTITQYKSELGNWSPDTGLIGNELNKPLVGTGTDGKPLTNAQQTGRNNYFNYVFGHGACPV